LKDRVIASGGKTIVAVNGWITADVNVTGAVVVVLSIIALSSPLC
jgi:hypothetical protein